VGVQPLGDGGHVSPEFFHLHNPQRSSGPVVIDQGLEPFGRWQIRGCQRPLTTAVTPQHPLRAPGPVCLSVDGGRADAWGQLRSSPWTTLLRDLLRPSAAILVATS
jgi:hypothetical protein